MSTGCDMSISVPEIRSVYGCDSSMCRKLWYHITWDMISPSIAIYHAIHRITQKHQARTISTKTDHLVAVYVLLCLLVSSLSSCLVWPGLCCRPSVAQQMRTNHSNSKHQPRPLTTRPATCVHDCFCSPFRFSFFPCLFSFRYIPWYIAWYQYRGIQNFS